MSVKFFFDFEDYVYVVYFGYKDNDFIFYLYWSMDVG